MHDDAKVNVVMGPLPSITEEMKHALQKRIDAETQTLKKLQLLTKLKQEEIDACRKSLDYLSNLKKS